MKKIINLIYLFILSLFIGFCVNSFSFSNIIKDVNGYNVISIKFSYIQKSGILGIKAYNEKGELKLSEQKTITIDKSENDENSNKDSYILHSYTISVPVINSHKFEFNFLSTDNSSDGIILINEILANNHSISIDSFIKNSKANKHYQIGSIAGIDGIFIKFNKEIIFDATNALKLPALTNAELISFDAEYQELYQLFSLFFIFLIFLINYIIYTKLSKLDLINNTSTASYFITIVGIVSSIALIDASYLQYIKAALTYLNPEKGPLFNYITFLHNFTPLLFFIYVLILISSLLKNIIFKLIVLIPSLGIAFVLLIDNCIMNVLGTRLNFRMSGNNSGQYKYFLDFIIKYISSEAGITMLLGFLLIILFCTKSLFSSPVKSKLKINTLCIFIFISLCGFIPRELLSSDLRFSNPFQINGWCINKVGDFGKSYSINYENRKQLDLQWEEQQGLNQKKNVIILLVESWGCSFTYACGLGPSYMPNIESLTENNLFFDNYYSVMPSTSMSYLSIVKHSPAIQFAWDDGNNYSTSHSDVFTDRQISDENPFIKNNELYQNNDLIHNFKSNGYTTRFISSTDLVFQMDLALKYSTYDEIIDAKNVVFNNIKERSTFNSVNDEQLFKIILSKIKNETNPYIYITKTASNHAPYNSPLGFQNLKLAFQYTDQAVFDFVTSLENNGYFDNGILVILGDHHAWGDDQVDPAHTNEPTYINKVPLIIIDGKHHGIVNHKEFSHASLGILLQYLELPTYKKNKFNINPLTEDSSEIIFGYDFEKMTFIFVKNGDRQATVILNGDDSEFIEKDIFSKNEMNDILGYIATFRR